MYASQSLLSDILWPATGTSRVLRNVFLAITGSIMIWISAKIQVPFYPVPMTMQTLVVLGLGAAFGWRLAGATVVLYLVQGALGLPVFAGTPEKGIGLLYMAGPTGGYLVGFVAAAMLVGYLAKRGFDKNPFTMFAAMILGNLVIYAFGVAWLAWGLPIEPISATFNGIGLEKAIQFGAMPFLLADAVKAAIAALLFPAVWLIFAGRQS